ncbi:MAG: SMC-Scp complex subunit ScpB [Oscillospiraceae bacterium]|nr:SMC-Scp complex subunit ScpB [Oscillospiraceae bacterium]
MELKKLESAIMSVLFACGEPISASRISEAVGADTGTIVKLLQNIKDRLEEDGSGIILLRLSDDYQLSTNPDNAEYVKIALDRRRNAPLSRAAMEVLSIIAYNQPVTNSFIEQVRGVSSNEVVSGLCEKGLVEEAGRLEVPGRPICYKTTANFLRCFGLESLAELPSAEELQKIRDDEKKADVESILLNSDEYGDNINE